jgi:hypothetical protein
MAVIRTMTGAGWANGTPRRGIGTHVTTASREVEEADATGTVAEADRTDHRPDGAVVVMGPAV